MHGSNERYNSSMGGNGQGGDEDKRKNQGDDNKDHDTTPRNRKPRAKAAGRQNTENNFRDETSPYQQVESAERALQNAIRPALQHALNRASGGSTSNQRRHVPRRLSNKSGAQPNPTHLGSDNNTTQLRQDIARALNLLSQLSPTVTASSSSALNQPPSSSPILNPSNAASQSSQSVVPPAQPFNMFAGQMNRTDAMRAVATRVGILPNPNASGARNNTVTPAQPAPSITPATNNPNQVSSSHGAQLAPSVTHQANRSLPAEAAQPTTQAPITQATLPAQPQAAASTNPTVKFSTLYFAPCSGLDVKHAKDAHSFRYWITIKPLPQTNGSNQQNPDNEGNQQQNSSSSNVGASRSSENPNQGHSR